MQRFAEDISRRMMYLNNLCPSDLRHGTDLLKSGGGTQPEPLLASELKGKCRLSGSVHCAGLYPTWTRIGRYRPFLVPRG